jgi:hypothetical protein
VTVSYAAIRGGNVFDQYATVPTEAVRAGDFSSAALTLRDPLTGQPFDGNRSPNDRISDTARALLTFLPLPNSSGDRRNFHYPSTNRSTQDTLNLRLAHPLGDIFDAVVLTSADDLFAHEIADAAVGPAAFGDSANGDVAVGDHADQPILFADRDRSGFGAKHEAGRFPRGLVGAHRPDVASHHIADLHLPSPS